MKKWAVGLVFALLSQAGWAVQAQVEGIVMPAWLERGRIVKPLLLGAELENGDVIRTGSNARVYLQLADGSVVKLGERARMQIGGLEQQRDVFRAALDVLQGAFRFTTGQLNRLQTRRDVTLRVATITAGIRGTDVWGKSTADADMFCLIEGQAALTHGERNYDLGETMTYVRAERNQPAGDVRGVSVDQLNKWAAETEIAAGQGGQQAGGRWQLVLGEFANTREALGLYDQLRREGFAARLLPLAGRVRVRLTDFASADEAQAMARHVAEAVKTPLSEVRGH